MKWLPLGRLVGGVEVHALVPLVPLRHAVEAPLVPKPLSIQRPLLLLRVDRLAIGASLLGVACIILKVLVWYIPFIRQIALMDYPGTFLNHAATIVLIVKVGQAWRQRRVHFAIFFF